MGVLLLVSFWCFWISDFEMRSVFCVVVTMVYGGLGVFSYMGLLLFFVCVIRFFYLPEFNFCEASKEKLLRLQLWPTS